MTAGTRRVVILGAPRSGTNMLRDVLTRLPGFTTWPCDEINYIWRHGNVRYPSDELPDTLARPEVQSFIRRKFAQIRGGAHTVVEKTCANSLRVGFVDRVLPDARFVVIRRDGLDVIASAARRWRAPLDLPYLARKARYVPLTDVPYYGARYAWNRLYRLWSREGRLAFWGPKLDGQRELLARHTVEELCALQWRRCVERTAEGLARIEPGRFVELEYEQFVQEPEAELARVVRFLDVKVEPSTLKAAVRPVSDRNVGKGRAALASEVRDRLTPLIASTMQRYGYAC